MSGKGSRVPVGSGSAEAKSTNITEKKGEILRLIEKLKGGSASHQATELRDSPAPAGSLRDRVSRRRRDLLALREKRNRMGLDLLEERLLGICQMLEERISRIEEIIINRDAPERETPSAREAPHGTNVATSSGMNTTEELSSMMPDLNIPSPIVPAGEEPGQAVERHYTLSGANREGVLPDIIQYLSTNNSTGIFVLEDDGRRIELFFRDGQLYHALCEGMSGQSAFFAAMATDTGRFYFDETDKIPGESTIEGNTQFMILEALRQIDEARENP